MRLRSDCHFLLLGAFLVLLTGCPKTGTIKSPPSVPPPIAAPPTLEKTFGEIRYSGLASTVITYKDIVILVDPVFEPLGPLGSTKAKLDTLRTPGQVQRTRPPAFGWDQIPPVDYLLLTDGEPHHLGVSTLNHLRKDLKIIATDEVVQRFKAAGFSQSKGLSGVQRIMLKKNEGFLFVSVLQSRNPASGLLVNGYLLEFDNGRNIFISGETVDEAVIRNFVYDLRDDGKGIDLAFIYAGGLRTKDDHVWQSADESQAANLIGLLQPRVAWILQTDGLDTASFDEARFRTALQDQMFSGGCTAVKSGDSISF